MSDTPLPNPGSVPSSDQTKLLLDGLSGQAIFSISAEGKIQTWSPGAAQVFGFAAGEISGQPYAALFERADAEAGVPEELLRRAGLARQTFQGWRMRKDGSRFWACSKVAAVRDAPDAVAAYVETTCDSSEEKASSDALARSEEAFRLLVQSVRDYAIFMLDRRGNVASWNAGAERIKGYRADEIIGQPYSRFFTPEDVAANRPHENLRAAAEQGHYQGEGWRVRKDGTRFWASVTLTALRDERGRLRGFAKVTRDVTDRKRTDELLRESEERYRQLVDGVRDVAILLLSPQGTITSWNAGAERVTGYHADEVIGKGVDLLSTAEDVAARAVERELAAAAERGRFSAEGRRVRRDGSTFWGEVTTTAIRDDAGALKGFAQVTKDVTAQRRAIDEVRRTEEKFRLLVEGLRETAIYLLDPNGRITSWNPGAERLKGYRASEVIGRPNEIFFTPEDRAAGRPERLLELAATEGQAHDEGWRVRKDGSRFWADVLVTALYDAGGLLRGFSKVTRDLTERRGREEEVRRLNLDLRERIANLDAFASTVAHDVASPLRAVTTYTELALEEWGAQAPPEAAEYLRRVLSAARNMRTLVQDLLTYSRLAHEEFRPEPLDLGALVEEVLLSMAHVLRESGAEVELVKPFPSVLGGAVPLRQALTNLISNAVKFVQPGSAPFVRISSERRGPAVRLLVEDRGIGIGPEDAKRLFQPFERLAPGGTYPGSGLGLAIVRRAAERMGGRVGMEPAEGGGSRFWIELPAA